MGSDNMPELPEVETVKETLKRKVLNKTIKDVRVIYPNIIENVDTNTFINKLKNQTILDISRRGKWLIFHLNDYYLLSHLRMEGKYFLKETDEEITKHQHVIFDFTDNLSLRYNDTRKFGKMHLVKKDELDKTPIKKLGLEPWDELLTKEYLKSKLNKKKPIKTLLLDQTIITGIGNIYADEICFSCALDPISRVYDLSKKDFENIVFHTQRILNGAIKSGGTTIRSYTSSLGVNGLFQLKLKVHNQKKCQICNTEIKKIVVDGRGTYRCVKCQKVKRKRG